VRISEIAESLGAEYEGDGDVEIRGVAELDTAGEGEIAFAYGKRAVEQVKQSAAACVLAPVDFPSPAGRAIIRVQDPRAAFGRLIRKFHPAPRPAPGTHPTAIVSSEASLGDGVSIGPYSVIGAGASIGDGTVIGSGCHIGSGVSIGEGGLLHDNVTIYHDVDIGRDVVLHSGVVLGADGFGFAMVEDHYEKFPQIGRVRIGDDVEIGANSCVDRAALGVTTLSDGVKLDNMVHIGHNATIGKHVVIAAQTGISGGVVVEDYVVIAGQVGIADKVRIETRAVLGAQAGVPTSKIIRAGQVVWGTPARPIKEYLAQLAQLSRSARQRQELSELRARVEKLEGGT
jgi:UDP-3-O-[3-hydroxymyristoyl] glucosamine N-acyltransferase